ARYFGFAHTCGSDHYDILWRYFVAQMFRHLLPSPPVAQGYCDHAFGLFLTNYIFIEFADDFSRSKGLLHRSKLLDYEFRVRVNAHGRSDIHSLLGYLARRKVRMAAKGAGGRKRVW